MLKPKWFIVFTLLLALGLASVVLAGPSTPHWGDPDIVEGIKGKAKVPREQVYSPPQAPLVIDVPVVGRIVLVRQEQREMPRKVAKRLPAASRTRRILR
jgi:hypothetical protein